MEKEIQNRKKAINMNDRRVRKTVKALREALIDLLETKSINQITVSELAALADVNRSTFYFYYDDVYDMVSQLQDEIYEEFYATVIATTDAMDGVEEYITYATRFFEFCKENAVSCKFLLNNDINSKLLEKIMTDVKAHIPDSAREYPKDRPEHYLTTYLLTAIIGVIRSWLEDGMLVSPEEMARYIGITYTLGSFKSLQITF